MFINFNQAPKCTYIHSTMGRGPQKKRKKSGLLPNQQAQPIESKTWVINIAALEPGFATIEKF